MSEFLDQLHLFGDIFDEFEEADWNGSKRRIATKKELRSLHKFHSGGFEKWPEMNDDCKQIVVGFMPMRARMRLGVCSKSDFQLVEKTPVRIERMKIDDESWMSRQRGGEFKVSMLLIDEELEKRKEYSLNFSQLGDDVRIRWKRGARKQIIVPNSNYHDEGVKFAEKWLKKSRYGVRDLTVISPANPFESSEIRFLPNVQKALICAENENDMAWWLERLPEQLNSLRLYPIPWHDRTFCLPADLLARPQVRNAKQFDTSLRAAFTDSDLLSLKKRHCRFLNIHVTDRGINDFLRNWQNGQCAADFRSLEIDGFKHKNPRILIEHLGAQLWDHQFRTKNRAFSAEFRRFVWDKNIYQIPSRMNAFDSLTMTYSDESVTIIRTGWAKTVNNVTYTEYSLSQYFPLFH